jgi:CBS domain containing-hemolysin-like protein
VGDLSVEVLEVERRRITKVRVRRRTQVTQDEP